MTLHVSRPPVARQNLSSCTFEHERVLDRLLGRVVDPELGSHRDAEVYVQDVDCRRSVETVVSGRLAPKATSCEVQGARTRRHPAKGLETELTEPEDEVPVLHEEGAVLSLLGDPLGTSTAERGGG